jgi:hypothetical protein
MSAILLLDYLKNSTSRDPMSLGELSWLSGMAIEVINPWVTELLGRGMIATADITRNNVTQTYLWPTGVSKPYNIATDYKISPKRHDLLKLEEATMPPPTTEAAAPVSRAQQILQYIETGELEVKKQMVSRTLQILQYIENNPNCPYADFKEVLKIKGASGYIGNHIERGDVIKTNISPRKNTYALKAGKTAKEIYNDGTASIGRKSSTPFNLLSAEDTQKEITQLEIHADAEFCIERLLLALPQGYELTISRRDNVIIEINGGQLNDVITVPIDKINDTLEVLNKLNELIAA